MGMLKVRGVSKAFAGVPALHDVSFEVARGEILCLLGPSGCGKTSFLRILGGLIKPTKGSVCLAGEPLTSPRRDIGFVFQRANLMPWRTVLHNVTLPLEIEGIDYSEARRQANELLELVGLSGHEEAYPCDRLD